MKLAQFKKRLAGIKSQTDADHLAGELYGTYEKPEGTPMECFVAGWVNAKDMQDERGHTMSDPEFLYFAFSALNSMYHGLAPTISVSEAVLENERQFQKILRVINGCDAQ